MCYIVESSGAPVKYKNCSRLHQQRSNAISPGMVGSEMAKEIWDQSGLTETVAVRLMRFGQPLDIARAVLFLGSELSEVHHWSAPQG